MTQQIGSFISGQGGGAMSYTNIGTWEGGWRWHEIIIFFLLLTYWRSVFIFIKQYSDSMCFSSILAENYESYLIYGKKMMHPTSFWSSFIKLNLVSKLVSTAAEWIVLSYSPKWEFENWAICPIYPW